MVPPTPTHFHPLLSSRIHSCPLPPTHSQPTSIYYHSFLAHIHSFSGDSHPLPLMFSPLLLILNPLSLMGSLSHPFSVHSQHSHPIQPITYHSNPYLDPVFYMPTCFMFLCAYVPSCFNVPYAYVIHFNALYCLFLYPLRAFVYVSTSGLFVYTALF